MVGKPIRVLSGVLISIVILVSCRTEPSIKDQVLGNPVHRRATFGAMPTGALEDRIQEVPREVLAFFQEVDGRPEYRPYEPTEGERQEFARAVALLPSELRTLMEEHLLGIYFIQNFQGYGLTDFVFDDDGVLENTMILNPDLFGTSLTTAVTLKERSCFRLSPDGPGLTVELSDELPGLLYILLHEGFHLADYQLELTPFIEPFFLEIKEAGAAGRFVSDSWDDYTVRASGADFPLADEVTFYGFGGGPLLSDAQMPELYDALAASPFPSLYAGFSWVEDAAEYYTYAVLCDEMGLDYRIRLEHPSGEDQVWRPMYVGGASRRRQAFSEMIRPLKQIAEDDRS